MYFRHLPLLFFSVFFVSDHARSEDVWLKRPELIGTGVTKDGVHAIAPYCRERNSETNLCTTIQYYFKRMAEIDAEDGDIDYRAGAPAGTVPSEHFENRGNLEVGPRLSGFEMLEEGFQTRMKETIAERLLEEHFEVREGVTFSYQVVADWAVPYLDGVTGVEYQKPGEFGTREPIIAQMSVDGGSADHYQKAFTSKRDLRDHYGPGSFVYMDNGGLNVDLHLSQSEMKKLRAEVLAIKTVAARVHQQTRGKGENWSIRHAVPIEPAEFDQFERALILLARDPAN